MAGSTWSHTLAFAAAVFALHAVAGCNAVLGIEPAELDTAAEALTCQWAAPNPGIECTGCDETCVSNRCKINECLIDEECRFALFNFRACVGTACTDAKGECSCILAPNKQATELNTCLNRCGPSCTVAAANTLCQGYCACMHQQCPTNEPNGNTQGGCLEACMLGLPAGAPALPLLSDPAVAAMWKQAPTEPQVGCLWYHCVAAEQQNDHLHCDHAINRFGICTNPPVPDPRDGLCDYPQRHANAPCNDRSQCCSGVCNGQNVCD